MFDGNSTALSINEVAPRDGLQNELKIIATDDKIILINRLSSLGYKKIEITAFVSPKAIPALHDAETVALAIYRSPDVIYTALIPNIRGAERAIDCAIDEFNLVMSASETHNLSNLRMTRTQSLRQLGEVSKLALSAKIPFNVSLSCSFGCPMEGEVPVDDVLSLIEKFAEMGASGVTLCDTTGMAYPNQVYELFREVGKRYGRLAVTAHFHDTRGMGLANTVAALEAGVRQFDMSLGGIGGCPYAPGASGNVATEDVVHMLNCMGYRTGMDVDAIIDVSKSLERLLGHALPAQLGRAGRRDIRHSISADFDDIKVRAQERDRLTETNGNVRA